MQYSRDNKGAVKQGGENAESSLCCCFHRCIHVALLVLHLFVLSRPHAFQHVVHSHLASLCLCIIFVSSYPARHFRIVAHLAPGTVESRDKIDTWCYLYDYRLLVVGDRCRRLLWRVRAALNR